MQRRRASIHSLSALLCIAASALAPAWPAAGAQASAQSPRGGQAEARDSATKGLPLEPARTLEYTTSRGSWTSLDVSPDGRTIVFDLLGDLYTLPVTGGRATRLTSGMAFDAQPRFSPDGTRIVFVSDRSGGQNLWTLTLDGKDTAQVTRGNGNLYTSPEWTPDGKYIVASRTYSPLGGEAKLWLFHVDGGRGIELIEEPEDLKTLGAAFGPDERYIWFAQAEGDWEYNARLPRYQLAVYDRRTGRHTVMTGRYGSAFRPALSPDGRWLVYGTRYEDRTGLRVRDLRSGAERWLAYPVQHDAQESRATLDALPGYGFTPDSRAIIVSYGGEIWRVPIAPVWSGDPAREPTAEVASAAKAAGDVAAEDLPAKIAFTVDVELQLGPQLDFEYRVADADTFTISEIRSAVPSPDGRRLAFTALDRLYVMDYPDGSPRALMPAGEGAFQPVWSPDGDWIAYVTWSDEEGGHVQRVRPDGRDEPERLTRTAAFYTSPAWSPDGRRIVAIRGAASDRRQAGRAFGAEFVWLPAAGGEVVAIAPAGGRGSPHFTSDPERIYAYSRSDGLVSFRWDGTDERTHLEVTGHARAGAEQPGPASLILMAPRGDLALAQVEDHLYVLPVPLAGGEAPTIAVANPDNAPVPVRRLTDIGGQFPAWTTDGRRVHWSIGNAHLVYDLDAAEAFEDSVRAASGEGEGEGADSAAALAAADTAAAAAAEDTETYRPAERRIRVQIARDVPRASAVLRGARVITMNGDEVIEDADIVVEDNRITAVGRRGSVEVPDDARVIDVAGTTIVPGFVDTHAHLRPDFGIHTRQPWEYLVNLAYGVTTTRDPQTSTTDVLTYGDLVETGAMLGPRIFSTGPGVFGSYRGMPISSLDDAREILKRYSEYYDTKTFKMYLAGNRQQRQWLIMAARELELMPTTEAGIDFALDMTHAMDGYPGIEHNLPIYPLYDDVVQLFARSGVVNTPTLIVSFGGPFGQNWFFTTEDVHDDAKLRRFTPHEVIDSETRRRGGGTGPSGWALRDEYVFDDHARFHADVIAAGGRAGVGSHGELQGLGYHWELWMLQSGGMSNHDALRAATIFGAQGIGLERDVGSIEPGKLADLVVLERNPLEDIRNTNSIRYVMKNGRLYEGDTLDEVYPRSRALPPMVWMAGEPDTRAGIRP